MMILWPLYVKLSWAQGREVRSSRLCANAQLVSSGMGGFLPFSLVALCRTYNLLHMNGRRVRYTEELGIVR